jgi:serine/threonine protein phosphatase PrpC
VDELMSIGDFAGLSGLSPKRLRTYAATGLLTPAAVDPETAYRYYAPGQLGDARLIDALRRAGVPLAEIKLLLRDRDPRRLDRWAGHVRADARRKQEALTVALALLAHEPVPGADDRGGSGMTALFRLDCAGRTDIGHVRERNEDAIVVDERVVAVADGLGGHAGGELASRLATELLAASFTGSSVEELATAVRAANWVVWERASSTTASTGMGTTMCAAGLVDDGALAVVHVGDSRAYLAHEGSVHRLTEDHSVAAELIRDGRLTEADAVGHPQRAILTRALGVGPDVQVDAVRRPVVPGDVLLLCSDGLFTHVSDDEIGALLLAGGTPSATADELLGLALSRGGEDNVSVVVAEVRS